MLITADIEEKFIGTKRLLAGLKLTVDTGEKIGIIGRNGVGKTTLFGMLAGDDNDYSGNINRGRGARVVATHQEHHGLGKQTVMNYILNNLPEYARLKRIIDTYPAEMGDDLRKIGAYSEALERFSQLDYFNVAERIRQSLAAYQLEQAAELPMASLSGGQKRFVELIRVEHSDADLALIDEPTNHMDYVAKAAFLAWFTACKHAVVVITHDRDVLDKVSRIVEIKDGQAENFPGNYSAYLKQNTERTSNELNEFEVTQRRIAKIKQQINYARSKKSSWTGTADKKNPFVVMENRLTKELRQLEASERPTFWIDQESAAGLRPKVEASYEKHKAKTIRIQRHAASERQRVLLGLDDVQVGYDRPLFTPLKLQLKTGDRLRLIGRNGAGKTTLVQAIIASQQARPATLLAGNITLDAKLRISSYEQEMSEQLFERTLGEAIEILYENAGLPVSQEVIMRTLSDYLFDPYVDRNQLVRSLSGGQKARLQLIKMFANQPNLLILDEPTNHLDLPSIEELEMALAQYKGALLFVSHDSYFAKNIGGDDIKLVR